MIEYNTLTELNITNRCNGKCKFCIRQKFTPEVIKDMSLDIIRNISSNIKYIYMSSYNSEPTLHPDFLEIVEIFKERNIILKLYTNQSTHNNEWWYNFASLISYHKDNCVISHLDGMKCFHESYRGISFDKTVSNMKSFVKGGGRLEIRTILFRGNENEVDDIYELSKEIGAIDYSLKPSWDYEIEGEFSKPIHYPIMNKNESSIQNNDKDVVCDLSSGKLVMDIDGNYYPCCRLLDKEIVGIRLVPDELIIIMKRCKENGELKTIEGALNSEFFQYILKNKNKIRRCVLSCSGGLYTPTIPINVKYNEVNINRVVRRNLVKTYTYYKEKYPFIRLNELKKINDNYYLSVDKIISLWGESYFEKIYNLMIRNDICDAFCYSQYRSKNWLYNIFRDKIKDNVNVLITAGWLSTHSIFLLKLNNTESIKSIDIDPKCTELSSYLFSDNDRFSSETVDIFEYNDYDKYDVIINTSCEHFDYVKWFEILPKDKIVILQNTNKIHETHINCVNSCEEFIESMNIRECLYKSSIKFHDGSKRFMIMV